MATLVRFCDDPGLSFFLFGPRGTGKSTWLRLHFPDALWLDLLSPETLRRYQARPERLRELLAGNADASVVVIDEVQRAPELLNVVHQILEEAEPPRFILTGSSSRKLKHAGVNLLAGRALLRSMHPFLAAELGELFDLQRALTFGLIPLIWNSQTPSDSLEAYVALYLREEVQQEGLVRNIGSFARFLESLSFSHGSMLNLSHIARECAVARKTVEGYVEILEDLLIAFRIPVFTKRAKRATVVQSKLYLFDAGVFRTLRPRGPLDRAEEIAGQALEGLVAQHLRAWIAYDNTGCSLYFWRTRGGTEVDFIIYGPQTFLAVEVKHSQAIRRSDLRGLRAFIQDYPEAEAIAVYLGEEQLGFDGVQAVPVAQFLKSLIPGTAIKPQN